MVEVTVSITSQPNGQISGTGCDEPQRLLYILELPYLYEKTGGYISQKVCTIFLLEALNSFRLSVYFYLFTSCTCLGVSYNVLLLLPFPLVLTAMIASTVFRRTQNTESISCHSKLLSRTVVRSA